MNTDDYEGHTKGNWCIDDGNGVVKMDEFWIRLFEPYCDDGITEDEDTINKKLMMSAPDLLAEVKRLREQVECSKREHEWELYDYLDGDPNKPVRIVETCAACDLVRKRIE